MTFAGRDEPPDLRRERQRPRTRRRQESEPLMAQAQQPPLLRDVMAPSAR
ncbi:hypothetical protein ACFV2N_28035 [Streptomyces sp. NPDC059680]